MTIIARGLRTPLPTDIPVGTRLYLILMHARRPLTAAELRERGLLDEDLATIKTEARALVRAGHITRAGTGARAVYRMG